MSREDEVRIARKCPACEGHGTVVVVLTDPDGNEYRQRRHCLPCQGTGFEGGREP